MAFVLAALTAGDDPNYWLMMTQQAEQASVTRKVMHYINKANAKEDKVGIWFKYKLC